MKKIEVNKDLLYHYYIEENNNIEKTSELMNLKYRTVQRAIKEFSFNKGRDIIQRQRENSLKEKYGVENVYQLDKSKKKSKETKLNRYGDENYNNNKKHIDTMIERYGVKSSFNLESTRATMTEKYGGIGYGSTIINNKIKQINLEKYGVPYPIQNSDIKLKAIKNNQSTFQDKYGVSYNFQIPEVRDKIKNTVQEKYGVPYFCMREECYSKNGHTKSKVNLRFSELLNSNSIEHEQEYHIKTYSFDFRIGNILVEINPTYTHNSTTPTWFHNSKKEPLSSNYHYNKSILARDNGFRCIHVWDWDDTNKIIDILKPKTRLYARKCIVKEVPIRDTNDFINKYHLQNTCKGQVVRLGLYYKDEIVQIMTFGKPRYNKNYEYELLRLCTKSDYMIVGGANKLFKYFIKNYNPKSIISYCDNSKFNGVVYINLGFTLKDLGNPSKHWFDGKRHITDNLLRQRGFDQLFNMNYGKGISNTELMIQNGFVEIYDSGQSVYIWESDKY